MILEIKDPVAYFCSEFAIDNDLPTYSGGLGVLAGDIMHEAAIQHYPLIGVGILYKGKDFQQHITNEGRVETRDSEFDHDVSFLRPTTEGGKPVIIDIDLGNYKVSVKSYHLRLSDKCILFFLSSNVEGNPPEWMADMDTLYAGGADSQIRQQILLGVGGVKLLTHLGIKPRLYHINEGRPEFIIWELSKNFMESENLDFASAWEKAKNKIVYTNHTLVSAGNLKYPAPLVYNFAKEFAKNFDINPHELLKDGITGNDTFDTTLFALNISKIHSSVSNIHASYAKRQWPSVNWIPITNGVNLARWQDSDFRLKKLTDEDLWHQHVLKKKELEETVVKRTGIGYDTNRLVITWARRLADYKQPRVIFEDIERLRSILRNQQKPVQLLFAGNTHSGDPEAKSIVEEIIKIFSTDLSGHAIFIPNYNIALANHLTSGSDVWLNTPKGNLEACGTSGMKAISNGALNLTVLDGWTYEAQWDQTGWILDPDNIAESFYKLMEEEICDTYYTRDSRELPHKWISMMRKSIELSKSFSTEVMFEKYKKLLYS